MLVEELFKLALIPPCVHLLSFDDEGRIPSDSMPEGFIDSNQGLYVNDPNREAMPIELS